MRSIPWSNTSPHLDDAPVQRVDADQVLLDQQGLVVPVQGRAQFSHLRVDGPGIVQDAEEADQDFGEGDCLLFEGGTDISSKLYGERAGRFRSRFNLGSKSALVHNQTVSPGPRTPGRVETEAISWGPVT